MGIYLFCNELRKYGKLVENNEVDDCMSLEGLIGGLLLATFGAFLVLFTIALW
jgi:hypothetical protein